MSFFQFFLSSPLIRSLLGGIGLVYLYIVSWETMEGYASIGDELSIIPHSFELSQKVIFSLSLLICILIFSLVRSINQLHRFSEKPTHIVALFFFFVLSAFPETLSHLFNNFGTLFAMLSLIAMLKIYNQPSVKGLIFLSSLLTSIASLFFFPAALLLIILFISIGVFRPFEPKNIAMAFIAFLLPYFYLFGIAYMVDFKISLPFDALLPKTQQLEFSFYDNAMNTFPLIGYALIVLIAITKSFMQKQLLIVRQRNQLSILLYTCFIFIIFSLFSGIEKSILYLLAGSSIFILLFYNNLKSKWLIEGLILILFGISVGNHFFSP